MCQALHIQLYQGPQIVHIHPTLPMTFAPVTSAVGAYLLHLSTSQHLLYTGRPLGISGILSNAVLGDRAGWRWSFLLGLVGSAVVGRDLLPGLEKATWAAFKYSKPTWISLTRTIVAGLLVGFGSKVSISYSPTTGLDRLEFMRLTYVARLRVHEVRPGCQIPDHRQG